MKLNVGIDIGGTKINLGIVDEQGKITDSCRIPTNAKQEPELTVQEIVKTLKKILKKNGLTLQDITFIGAGVPGTVNTSTGLVSYCPNLSWFDIPIGDLFERYMGRKVVVEQDSRNAALAEKLFGAGKGCDNILCVAVGTGIGGGIIIDGKPLVGAHGAGGEIGHLCGNYEETDHCGCGNTGCLEQYASATGITRLANIRLAKDDARSVLREQEVSAKTVFDAVKAGDAVAEEIAEEFGKYLGHAMANLAAVADPSAIVIGGGVSKAGEILIEYVEKNFKERAFFANKDTEFVLATLGNDAGICGAAKLILS